MEPTGCPETSVSNCHYWLRDNPEERSSDGPRLFRSGVLRERREEVTAEWGKLHIDELHDLYFPRCVVLVITSRWTKWVGHVARMDKKKCLRCFGGET